MYVYYAHDCMTVYGTRTDKQIIIEFHICYVEREFTNFYRP